jgi:ribosome-associated translation inhibitor RaiA
MPFEIHSPKTVLSPDAEHRIRRHIAGLERRLVNFHNPQGRLTVKDRPTERRHTADLVLELGVDGVELVSHHAGESAEHAARLAIEDVERQLERYVSTLRGEATFGTPSRREPKAQRPSAGPTEDDDLEELTGIDVDSDEERDER